MEVKLIGSTKNLSRKSSILKFGRNCGRICYSEKDFEDVQREVANDELTASMVKSGHHSVFEHVHLNFYFKGIPKALAMVFNNEEQYVTSEKSARYTQMRDISPDQKTLYDKWMGVMIPEIDLVYPKMSDGEKREGNIKKLAQENARYMTSVFTPTKMVHTLNIRQLNYLIHEFDKFIAQHGTEDSFNGRLAEGMRDFVNQVEPFRIAGLENQTDRHLSFFGNRKVEEHFGDVYSTNYHLSFAGLAQAHRHRTLKYNIFDGIQQGAKLGFFIPALIRGSELEDEWLEDLEGQAKYDFPQAQLVGVSERGCLEDFRSKLVLRLCGHAQYEIMENTSQTARKYAQSNPKVADWLGPKCS
jgi:thymidylate synthase ThyX